jgi:hypothetical protein
MNICSYSASLNFFGFYTDYSGHKNRRERPKYGRVSQNITSPEQFSKLVDFQDQILSSLTAQIKGWKTDCTRDDGVIRIEGNKVKIYDKDGIASLTVRWEPVSGPSWAGRKYFFFRSPFPKM